jgi:hypothetical protein
MVSWAPRAVRLNSRTPRSRSSGDALGDGLLGDRQVGGGLLELARVRDGDGDVGAYGIDADPR